MHSKKIKLGILGGGQLGKMLIQAALDFNIEIHVLENDPNAPCKDFIKNFNSGSFKDYDHVIEFGKNLDLITIEIENVNVAALKELSARGVKVYPQPEIIEIIQDKGLQKGFLQQMQIPTSNFELLDSGTKAKFDNKAFVLKLRTGGYDGRGVMKVSSQEDLKNAFPEPCVLEELVDIDKEISVIVARNISGDCQVYDPVEMLVDPKANLVDLLACPAELPDEIINSAKAIAQKIAKKLGLIGILAVEMFVTKNSEVLVNELAPRPHNTGHHTIEACRTSQYQQLLRAIIDLPLGSTELIEPAVMLNILGDSNSAGTANYQGLAEVLKLQGVYVHIYGKSETRPFRKMGHVTVMNKNMTKALELASIIKKTIKVTT